MRIYFVRHGQTNYNVDSLFNDDPSKDVHLTAHGKEQANSARKYLKDKIIDKVFISEFQRTKETAEIICEHSKEHMIVDSRINERSSGFDSQPVNKYNEALAKSEDSLSAKFHYGESFYSEKKRVLAFLEYLKSVKLENVLVVSHGEPLKIIKAHFEGVNDIDCLNVEVKNCEVYTVDI